jgi:hypothetical protein
MAGKDINWEINTKELPKKLETSNLKSISNLELLSLMRTNKEQLENKIKITDKKYSTPN